MQPDTIFALASGRPPAAIAIIRVSGPLAHDAARKIARDLPSVREAALRRFSDPEGGETLDQGLLLIFEAPASATGEDVAEFHIHGSRAATAAMLAALGRIPGLREAAPGDFTRRAFENGRIDLTEAEGLADLLEAETEAQRRAAMALADGGLRRRIEQWQERIFELSAAAETAIDYVDGYDENADFSLYHDCGALALELREWLERPRVEPLSEGVRVVLAGPPNSGKSSLLNVLVGHERAIVTDVPGTTRDRIDVPMGLNGIPVVLTDTAGLRQTGDEIERIGVDMARSAAETADVLLWLGAPADAPDHPRVLLIHSRCDLPERGKVPSGSLAVSAVTGEGIDALLSAIIQLLRDFLPPEDGLLINRRQAEHLEEAALLLQSAASETELVIAADHLRRARSCFDRVTGRAGVEDLLDRLFSRFCLGK